MLEADIPLKCHVVYGTLAEASDIPYIMPVLEHARERGGKADCETLSRELFIKLPLSRSILGFCAENGLVKGGRDGRYSITQAGTDALESGMVFVSRTGMWKVHYADHGMIPGDMRAVQIEGGARDAGQGPRRSRHGEPQAEALPKHIANLEGRTARTSFGSRRGEAILHCMLAEARPARPDLRLRLRVAPGADGSTVSLAAQRPKGGRGEDPAEIALPGADSTYDDVIGLLIRGDSGAAWDKEAGRLRVRYGDTSGDERATMSRELEPRRVRIGKFEFRSSREVVDLFPASEEDARAWAGDMLAGIADEYLTREAYESLAARVRARFKGFEIELGARTDSLRGNLETTKEGSWERRLFWLIVSMEDWGL